MPKERKNRPEVDDLLPDVDQEVHGDQPAGKESSESQRDDVPMSGEDEMSASRHDDGDTSRQDAISALAEKLDVLMDGPGAPYASDVPDLSARSNGYLSSEVEAALQQAASVLKNRYSKASKSLIMDYAIRLILWDLRKNAGDSNLVRWLDEVLDGPANQ